jgi:nicotinamidase-related amidase
MLFLNLKGHRCAAYDRRGHGRSSVPAGGYDYDNLADDLHAVLEALDVRDAVLVGHSMASGELVRYLTRHGGASVRKLVFVSPYATPSSLKIADNADGVTREELDYFLNDDPVRPTIPRVISTPAAAKGDAPAPHMKETNMPLTKLDDSSALVMIDLQKGIVGLPCAHPADEIVGRAARLASAFRGRGLPVVLVNVAGRAPGRTDVKFNFTPPADWTELVPELDRQPSDYTVTKQQIGAFYGTALEQILRRHGVTQVVLAGVATSSGVEATARNAYDHGYNVTLVVDAMTDLSADAHRHSVEAIFPRLGETATTEDVIRSLTERTH